MACKKQTIMANSSTEAEYVDAANCCGQDSGYKINFHTGSSSVPSGVTRVPTGSFHFSYWLTTSYWSPELGPPTILATIDETPYTITEDSVRSQLQLADDGGIDDLPITDIYSGIDNLSTKSGSWDQFGSSLAVALICLSDGRKFNWSSYIFKGMVSNIGNAKMFLMYPRFIQTILGIETSVARQYRVFKLSSEGAGVAAQAVPLPIPETIPETRPDLTNLKTICLHPQDNKLLTRSLPPMWKMNLWEVLSMHLHQVSTLVHKVNSLETELKTHKKLFKDVVGKLVKKVKAMEAKLKPKKRKVVVSDSDQDEGGEQTVDLDALIALANVAVTVDSNIPPGGASNDLAASSHIPFGVPTDGDFAPAHSTSPSRDLFKGKGVAEHSSPISKRTKKQLADERLSEIEAARLKALERERFEKEKAKIARQDEIYAKQLEQEEEMSAS
ncbi:hypothetical protein Tco_1312665 [Tanacetum coccineum]